MSNFGSGLAKKHFYEIILKFVHRLLKTFFLFIAQAAILFNRAEWFEQFR